MGFIENLNKYAYQPRMSNTGVYKDIISIKNVLIQLGLDMKIKSEFDLLDYEIIYRGVLNQKLIDKKYEIFNVENDDVLSYLNYEEKRCLFNNELRQILDDCPHYEYHQQLIYIPYLEDFMNSRFTNDYQMLLLKQHKEYLHRYKVNQKTPSLLYGEGIYLSDFTSLSKVYEDERHICLYYDVLKKVYILKKDTRELLNYLYVLDHQSMDVINIDDIKQLVHLLELYLYEECLNFMLEKQYISKKTYQKVLKKYK